MCVCMRAHSCNVNTVTHVVIERDRKRQFEINRFFYLVKSVNVRKLLHRLSKNTTM